MVLLITKHYQQLYIIETGLKKFLLPTITTDNVVVIKRLHMVIGRLIDINSEIKYIKSICILLTNKMTYFQ